MIKFIKKKFCAYKKKKIRTIKDSYIEESLFMIGKFNSYDLAVLKVHMAAQSVGFVKYYTKYYIDEIYNAEEEKKVNLFIHNNSVAKSIDKSNIKFKEQKYVSIFMVNSIVLTYLFNDSKSRNIISSCLSNIYEDDLKEYLIKMEYEISEDNSTLYPCINLEEWRKESLRKWNF